MIQVNDFNGLNELAMLILVMLKLFTLFDMISSMAIYLVNRNCVVGFQLVDFIKLAG